MLGRRNVMGAGALALLSGALISKAKAQEAPAQPTRPANIPDGRPGEFDWLAGEWRIANRMIASGQWIEFPGEATVRTILAGVGSVEELRIPARNFSGMGLRMLDVQNKLWNDHWVNAQSGVVAVPGMPGGFRDGVGHFFSDDVEDGRPVQYLSTWDEITPVSCRWRQGVTRDGGRTREDTWIMHWTRVAPAC
jgi:hypothetical protein